MKPIIIGHLDTGVCSRHPALRGKIGRFTGLDKNGFTTGNVEAYDTASHGTHTAGIICRHAFTGTVDAEPGFKLNVVAVPERGKTLLNLVTGMNLMLEQDIHIACLSIGIKPSTPVFSSLIKAFISRGILVVAPIGNKGAGTAQSPGSYPGVLSVGAVNDNGKAADFSGSIYDKSGTCSKPDIMAPGVNIHSASPGGSYIKRSGTSMACAYIAGIAAKLWQARPSATADDIKYVLLNTTKKLPPHHQNRCRTGIADPYAAMTCLMKPASPGGERNLSIRPATMKPPHDNYPYIDSRFLGQYKRAHPGGTLEAIIAPRNIIPRVSTAAKISPHSIRCFNHADMACVEAIGEFYDALLKHKELQICSAVDINIFDF